MTAPDPRDYIDIDTYPLERRDGPGYARMLDGIRSRLARDGCAVLPGFIRAEGISDLIAEADAVAGFAHRSFNRTNAYFTEDDPALAPEHPVRRFHDRSNTFVPADNFGVDSILRRGFVR